jgi:hypothetical protein
MTKRVRWMDVVHEQQAAWVQQRGLEVDTAGYVLNVEENLLCLSAEARSDFEHGSGKELGDAETRGKLGAPWSSSALAANVFEYWRDRDKQPLREALQLQSQPLKLRLEATFPTGFSSIAPANLDVVLEADEERVAIESKFCEPFEGGPAGKRKSKFAASYVDVNRERDWLGLAHLMALARDVKDQRQEFFRLDVPQLTKHCLALRRDGRPFELLLVWYCPPPEFVECVEMQNEIDRFCAVIARDGIRFRALTYQGVFTRLQTSARDHLGYLAYLSSRYFPKQA